jgi:transposase-like protein
MHPETGPESTLACPYCRGSASPIEVSMQTGERTLTYVCSTCHKTWTVTTREFPPTEVETK